MLNLDVATFKSGIGELGTGAESSGISDIRKCMVEENFFKVKFSCRAEKVGANEKTEAFERGIERK